LKEANMKKIAIIINGVGGSGKDTICNFVSKCYKTDIISQIDPIKKIAKYAGWNGEKDDKSRKMLSDLKMLFVTYNDLPFSYTMEKIKEFEKSDDEILFIHIREREEILKIVKNSTINVFTLLIRRIDKEFTPRIYGNTSDDKVENYDYDFIFVSDYSPQDELESRFMSFFNTEMIPKIHANTN